MNQPSGSIGTQTATLKPRGFRRVPANRTGVPSIHDEEIWADFSNSTRSFSSAAQRQIHHGFWRSWLPFVVSGRKVRRQARATLAPKMIIRRVHG
jgi:hypothetical protein